MRGLFYLLAPCKQNTGICQAAHLNVRASPMNDSKFAARATPDIIEKVSVSRSTKGIQLPMCKQSKKQFYVVSQCVINAMPDASDFN